MTIPTAAPSGSGSLIELLKASVEAARTGTLPPAAEVITPRKTTKELDPAVAADLKEFKDAKELLKLIEDLKDAAEEKIRQALDGADIGTINGVTVVKRSYSHNSHLDMPTVRDGYPEAYSAAYRRKDYDYLMTP